MSHPIAVDPGNTDSVATEKLNQRNRRVASYRELVRPIALHYSALSPECADDLIQVGLLGLIRAAELFLPSLGTPFSALPGSTSAVPSFITCGIRRRRSGCHDASRNSKTACAN